MDEYISKRAAIDMICSKCTVDTPDSCSTIQRGDDWCEEMYYLLKTPAAAVAPVVHGRWLPIVSYNNTYKCSECGRLLVDITDGKNKVAKHYPYCHCGAKMDGERKE